MFASSRCLYKNSSIAWRRASYATLSPHVPPPITPYEIFDEAAKIRQRDRAILRLASRQDRPDLVDYLREEIGDRLAERVEDLRVSPKTILELASHAGQITRIIQDVLGEGRQWWLTEASNAALHRDGDGMFSYPPNRVQLPISDFLQDDRMQSIQGQIDAVFSGGGLHWIGDIVGALTQARHLLKPDGVFLGAVLGGDTLFELRTSLQLAEQERRGGIANRVSPMIDPADAPSLLTRAGLTLTTVDVEDFTVSYPSVWELMADLRDMGESNAILGRRPFISRDVLLSAEAIYNELFGREGGIPATFQIVFLIGWRPGPNEPKPLARGSGATSLKDVL